MHIVINIHDPNPRDMVLVSSENSANGRRVPASIRFGSPVGQVVNLYLSSAYLEHEDQWVDVVSRCDEIIEYVSTIRTGALRQLQLLRPDEQIVGFLSEAEAVDREGPGDVPGWDGAGADVEAQRG